MRKPVLPALVLFASLAGIALTGCSAPADTASETAETDDAGTSQAEQAPSEDAADQSVDEACGVVNEALSSLQAQLSAALEGLSSGDTASGVEALNAFETELDTAAAAVTNPEVSAAVVDFQEKVGAFNEVIGGLQSGGEEAVAANAEQLQTSASEMQTSAVAIQELCAA
jgi:hypothetical protein